MQPSGRREVRTEKPFLTKLELSERTGLSPSTIQRLKAAGKIPFFQPAGKRGAIRFPRGAIESALKGHSAVLTNDAPIVGGNIAGAATAFPHTKAPVRCLPGPQPRWMQHNQNQKQE